MAYSAGVGTINRNAGSRVYPRARKAGLLRGFFGAFFRLMGFSMLMGIIAVFLIIISIALIYGYSRAVNSEYFFLKNIEIKGNSRLTYSQLVELMGISPGDSLLQLKMSVLHENLADNPWIENVSVKRVFPDELLVTVQEKQAYFWVQHGDKMYYADQEGNRITSISPDRFVSLPVLYLEGEGPAPELSMLVNHLEGMNFPFSFQEIAWINVRPAGSIEMRIESFDIDILMDQEVLTQGPERLNRIWKDLKKRNETDRVKRIILLGNNAWVGLKS